MTGTENAYPNVVQAGDYLVIEINGVDNNGGLGYRLYYAVTLSINGSAYAVGGSFDGTGTPFSIVETDAGTSFTARYEGPVHTASLPTHAGGLSIAVACLQKSGGPVTIAVAEPYSIVVTHYRSNS